MRKELKYEISYQEYKNIVPILDIVLEKDIHSDETGEYQIKSMYFDNHLHEVENDKENDINAVQKYRIRMYNNDDNTILLERKANENDYIKKINQKLTRQDVEKILSGDYKSLLEDGETLKTELYLKMILKQLRPAIIIEYKRIAYRDRNLKLSITIDKDIKSTKDCKKFFDENINKEAEKKYILEIKYEKYVPEYIKNIIINIENKKIARSKFMTQLKKYNKE